MLWYHWTGTGHLGKAVRGALSALSIPLDELLRIEPALCDADARSVAAWWRRRAWTSACKLEALCVLRDARERPDSSAAHLLRCSSGVAVDGLVLEAVLISAPMPYLRMPFCRNASQLRALLRANALLTRAFQAKCGRGRAHAQCTLCDAGLDGTALHYLRDCRNPEIVTKRERAYDEFTAQLLAAGVPVPHVRSLLTLLRRGLRGSLDLLQFLCGVCPAWWPRHLCDLIGCTTADGQLHRVRGYVLQGERSLVEVGVLLLSSWIDSLSLRLLTGLCATLRLWSVKTPRGVGGRGR